MQVVEPPVWKCHLGHRAESTRPMQSKRLEALACEVNGGRKKTGPESRKGLKKWHEMALKSSRIAGNWLKLGKNRRARLKIMGSGASKKAQAKAEVTIQAVKELLVSRDAIISNKTSSDVSRNISVRRCYHHKLRSYTKLITVFICFYDVLINIIISVYIHLYLIVLIKSH